MNRWNCAIFFTIYCYTHKEAYQWELQLFGHKYVSVCSVCVKLVAVATTATSALAFVPVAPSRLKVDTEKARRVYTVVIPFTDSNVDKSVPHNLIKSVYPSEETFPLYLLISLPNVIHSWGRDPSVFCRLHLSRRQSELALTCHFCWPAKTFAKICLCMSSLS